ncbi:MULTISPECIES: hypothetical protein [unclassified Blastococcus]
MTLGGVLVLLVLIGLGALAVSTLVVAVRGGRGPADPPASHARVDPAGFPVPPAPRGVLTRRPARPAAAASPAGAGAIRVRRPAFRLRSAPGLPMQR